MPVFTNEPGVPLNPILAEIIIRGSVTASGIAIRPFLQIWHFLRVGGAGAESVVNLCNEWQTIMDTVLANALSIDYTGGVASGRFLDDPTNPEVLGNLSSNGTVTGDRLPNYGTVTCQLKSDGRGRNYKGSKHFGPIAESQTEEDLLNAGGITAWDAVAAQVASNLQVVLASGNTWQLIVLSRSLSVLEPGPTLFTGAYVIDCTANHTLGTMRRRKLKNT